jgi:hypothetical protein
LLQFESSRYIFKGFAALPPDNSLFLAQEPVAYRLSDGQPFIRIAEQFEELLLDDGFNHFPQFTCCHVSHCGGHIVLRRLATDKSLYDGDLPSILIDRLSVLVPAWNKYYDQ